MKKGFFLSIYLLALNSINAYAGGWFTGSLLAPACKTVDKGKVILAPRSFYNDSFASHGGGKRIIQIPNTHLIYFNSNLIYGLTDRIDIQGMLPISQTNKNQRTKTGVDDFTLTFGFQALREKENTYTPNLRITLSNTFPNGRYQNLNPSLLGVDATGIGSYQTTLGFNFEKSKELFKGNFLRQRVTFAFTLSRETSVENFNSYGGGIGTRGKVKPGDVFLFNSSSELQLTQQWVAALDFNYVNRGSSVFRGNPGINPTSLEAASVGNKSSRTLSVSPALEYNFSKDFGLVSGAWFSIYTPNTNKFVGLGLGVTYKV